MRLVKFAIKTLGCKVNQYEEEVLRENLLKSGFISSSARDADLVIINSCTVTAKADEKTRRLIKRLKRENPKAQIFVTGCYAVLEEDIKSLEAISEVDVVVPGGDKMKLPLVLSSLFARGEGEKEIKEEVEDFSGHTRAFLKVQDGCDERCTYCKVNIVRGPSRSRDEGSILREVSRLAARGYKEIVLTGICLGSWKGEEETFPRLVKKILEVPGDFRIRLSSIEPKYIGDSLIQVMASSGKISRHLHVPLQSGSDRVLKLMNRNYTAEEFRNLISRIRRAISLVGITMDVIAGFPGESEEDFEKTLGFVNEIKPSRLHVFRYSDRKGTPSFLMGGKIDPAISKERVERLIKAGDTLQREFCGKFTGKEVEVLLEKRSKGDLSGEVILEGYTSEYLRVKSYGFNGFEGDIIRVKIDCIDEKTPSLVAKAANSCVKI